MERKKYRTIVALDCLLCVFYTSKSIPAYIEACKNNLGFAALFLLNGIFIIILFCFIKYPKLRDVSSLVQNLWAIMKLLVFGLFVTNLRLDMVVIVNIISLIFTIIFIVMQVWFYKHNKFYFER